MHFENLEEYRNRFKIHTTRLNQSFLAFVALFAFFIAISGAYLDYKRVEAKRIKELEALARIQLLGRHDQQEAKTTKADTLGKEVKELRDKELSVSLLGTSLPAKISLAGIMFSAFSVIWALFIRVERRRTCMLVGGFYTAAEHKGKRGLSIGECPFWLAPVLEVPQHRFLNPEGKATVGNVLESVGWSDAEHRNYTLVMRFISSILVLSMVANVGITLATTGPIALGMELTTSWMTRIAVFTSVFATLFVGWLLYQELFAKAPTDMDLGRRQNLRQLMRFSGAGLAFVVFRDVWSAIGPPADVEGIVKAKSESLKKLAENKVNPRFRRNKAKLSGIRNKTRDDLLTKARTGSKEFLENGKLPKKLSPVLAESIALYILNPGAIPNKEQGTSPEPRETPITDSDLLNAACSVLATSVDQAGQRYNLENTVRQLDLLQGLASRLPADAPGAKRSAQAFDRVREIARDDGYFGPLKRFSGSRSDRWQDRWQKTVTWHHPVALAAAPSSPENSKQGDDGNGKKKTPSTVGQLPVQI